MSFINYSSREINCKIVYYGPGLCGKTTNLQYIYEKTNPQAKGKMISLATETERTLFFDFLPLSLGEIRGFKTRFHLYTVPGQVFYDASRKLILKGVDGVVFVADSQVERMEANIESLENLRTNLTEHGYDLDKIPYVVQYNKRDLPNAAPLDELKTKILENLKAGYAKRSEQELNEQIFKALIEKTDFELPEAMVNIELEGIINEAQQSFTQHNIDMEQLGMTTDSLRDKYRETAENQVRRHLLLNKLVEQESLELTDDDLENAFQEMADTYNQPVEGIKGFYSQNQEKLEVFKHTLLEKNALKLIIDNSDVTEVEPKPEEKDAAEA